LATSPLFPFAPTKSTPAITPEFAPLPRLSSTFTGITVAPGAIKNQAIIFIVAWFFVTF